jgi:hypothetical protein
VTDQKVPLSERPTGSDHLGVPRVRAALSRSVISSGSLEISCVGGARTSRLMNGGGLTCVAWLPLGALARRLLIALWRYLDAGVVPDGAQLNPTEV